MAEIEWDPRRSAEYRYLTEGVVAGTVQRVPREHADVSEKGEVLGVFR